MHRARCRVEDPGLYRTRRTRLLRRQLQQPQQPGVLCSQPSDLGAQRRQLVTQRASIAGWFAAWLVPCRHSPILSRLWHRYPQPGSTR